MGRYDFRKWVADNFETETVSVPKVPLIEIYGGKRVLIENHCGVLEYTDNSISVKTKLGRICVCGCSLKLAMMSRDRLIICGKLDAVYIKEA